MYNIFLKVDFMYIQLLSSTPHGFGFIFSESITCTKDLMY